MRCPRCGCEHSSVTNTWNQSYKFSEKKFNRIRRRRVCRYCKLPFISHETVSLEESGLDPQETPTTPAPDSDLLPNPFIK